MGCLHKGIGGTVRPTLQFAPFAQMYVYVCECLWVRGLCIPFSVMEMNMSWLRARWGKNGGEVHPRCLHSVRGAQNDSSCPTERSPFGVEARDEPLSMLSEPELWCCCSEPALEVTVEDEVEEVRVFSLKSVMITVTFPTVMASCWAVLLSMFFSLGLPMWREREIFRRVVWQRTLFRSLKLWLQFLKWRR